MVDIHCVENIKVYMKKQPVSKVNSSFYFGRKNLERLAQIFPMKNRVVQTDYKFRDPLYFKPLTIFSTKVSQTLTLFPIGYLKVFLSLHTRMKTKREVVRVYTMNS